MVTGNNMCRKLRQGKQKLFSTHVHFNTHVLLILLITFLPHPSGGPASISVYVAAQSERGSPDLCHAWSAIWSDQPLCGQHVQQHLRAPQPLRRLYGGPAQR